MKILQNIFSVFKSSEPIQYHISEELLKELLVGSKQALPTEFLALLTAKQISDLESVSEKSTQKSQVIISYYIIPETTLQDDSATLKSNNIPITENIVGSFHSHPNGVLRPSEKDSEMFHRYPVNIIAGPPFTLESWVCFNKKSKERELKITTVQDTGLNDEWERELNAIENID